MFVLGHLGIGSKICQPWAENLPRRWLLLGTLVPDLIDKPLYYGLSWIEGASGADLGLISGTRTIGHTGLLLLSVTFIAIAKRSRILAALALGVASHLLLDNLGDVMLPLEDRETLYALFFPFLGMRFPIFPFHGAHQHLGSVLKPYTLGGEVLGAAILVWDAWKSEHQLEIIKKAKRFLR